MSVTITKQDLLQVKLFVELCDKLGKDYKTHHSLQIKANKLLETNTSQQEETSNSIYKTATGTIYSAATSFYTWWNSWENQEEVIEEPSFEEKVAEIIVAIIEERAEEVTLDKETHTDMYYGCEC
jgi:hypothetical protein